VLRKIEAAIRSKFSDSRIAYSLAALGRVRISGHHRASTSHDGGDQSM
jgi:hypothetical protein